MKKDDKKFDLFDLFDINVGATLGKKIGVKDFKISELKHKFLTEVEIIIWKPSSLLIAIVFTRVLKSFTNSLLIVEFWIIWKIGIHYNSFTLLL